MGTEQRPARKPFGQTACCDKFARMRFVASALWLSLFFLGACDSFSLTPTKDSAGPVPTFSVTGIVRQVSVDQQPITVTHQAIPNYMPAMTMEFRARKRNDLAGINAGNQIAFRLTVTTNESSIA